MTKISKLQSRITTLHIKFFLKKTKRTCKIFQSNIFIQKLEKSIVFSILVSSKSKTPDLDILKIYKPQYQNPQNQNRKILILFLVTEVKKLKYHVVKKMENCQISLLKSGGVAIPNSQPSHFLN